MPIGSDTEEARRRAEAVDAVHPRPRFDLPAYPDENVLDAVIEFAWRIVKWNVEEILDGHTKDKKDLPDRQAESRVLAELHRTLEKFTRLKKARASEKQDERSDAELNAELLENFRKVLDARGT